MAACYTMDYFADAGTLSDLSFLGGRSGTALTFLIPALQFIQFHILGTLYATDLLSLAVLLLAGASNIRALNRRGTRTFLIFGIIWLMAQGATDLIRATPFHDYARGWAMIGFTLVNFASLSILLYDNRRRIMLCALGFVAGDLLTYFLKPNIFASAEPWKFGYGYAVTLLVVLVAVFMGARRKRMLAGVLLMAAAALNLYEGFRSLAGECFLTATYSVVTGYTSNFDGTSRSVTIPALISWALLGLSAVGLFRVYAYCASSGLLGSAALQKYEIESAGRYGVVAGGRMDFLTGLDAALDSPLVGHGSWAKDWRYTSRQEALLPELGYQSASPSDSWIIPAHSYLIGAWVDAGIIGALFWLWVLSVPVRVLALMQASYEPLAPLVLFLAFGLMWDVLFSPFGAAQRFSVAFVVVALM